MGVLFIVSGPSGVGKGTLVKLLIGEHKNLSLSISCTTRKPREGEKDGREYFFISREEFVSRIEENDFLEYDEHFGNLYGTPKSFVLKQLESKSVILEIDVSGALKVREKLKDSGERLVLVMVVPPDMEELESRLSGRDSETEEEKQNRLARVKYELAQQDQYDYVVVNDDLNVAKTTLENIFENEINAWERR